VKVPFIVTPEVETLGMKNHMLDFKRNEVVQDGSRTFDDS